MRRTQSQFVAVAFLSCLLTSHGANLLKNGDFQFAPDGSYNPNGGARYWVSFGNAAREDWGVSIGNDQYGATVRNWAGDAPDGGWYQDVEGEPGARYILTCQLTASADLTWSEMQLKFEFYDDGYALLSAETNVLQGVGIGGWTTHEIRATAPAHTRWVRCVFAALGLSTTGSVSSDDYKLIEGPPGNLSRRFNLLENGGFQLAGDASTVADPDAWMWQRWGDATRENWFSFEGDGFLTSIHNWNSLASDGGWFQDVPAQPGRRYRLNGFFQKEACYTTSLLEMKLEFLDAYRDPIAVFTEDLSGANEWWTDYNLTADAPTGTVWVRATVAADGQGSCGALKIDGLRLLEVPIVIADLQNLLENTGFTNGIADWMYWGGATNVDWDSQDGDGFAGALQNFAGNQGDGGLYQDTAAAPDEKFHVSGWFKAESWYGYANLFLILEFRDAGDNYLGNAVTKLNGMPDAWAYYEVEGRAPVNAAVARAIIMAQGQGSGGYFYFDHLRMVKVPDRSLQRLEPPIGAYAAANPDMSFEDFNRILDWDHVGNGVFLSIPNDYHASLDGLADTSLRNGAIFMVTIAHWGAERVGDVDEQLADDWAEWCRYWNDRGLPIFVRYGHEMNADWYYTWGLQPQQYRRAFRLIAEAVHRKAPLTAMVYAPYLGGGYPYDHNWKNIWDYIYDGNLRGTYADFALLDTDGNGFINHGDDPYGPYYPGDEHADWVGVSIYHWSTGYPFWFNTYPWDRFVEHDLTGENLGYGQYDFYFRFSASRGKPLMIPETGCMFKPTMPPNWYNYTQYSNDEAYNKSKWVEQLYNVLGDTWNAADVANHFPLLKAIYYFSIYKFEGEADGPPGYGGDVDWTLTSNPYVRDAYRYHITAMKNQRRHWLRAGDLHGRVYSWNTGQEDWEDVAGPPFQLSVTNDWPVFEGRGCLRIDYDGTERAEDFDAAVNLNAMKDAIGWRDFNALQLYVRLPPPEPVNPATVSLIMDSSETGNHVLATLPCPADGAWHRLIFPYDWSLHDISTWLNLRIRLEFPFGEARTVYLDAVKAVMDTDLDGIEDEIDTDDDNDGIPDSPELARGGDPYETSDAAADDDGDGFDAYHEYAADTDGSDDQSFLRVEAIEPGPSNGVEVLWDGRKHVTYQLQHAPAVSGPWNNAGPTVRPPEHMATGVVVEAGSDTNVFYRLRVSAPIL